MDKLYAKIGGALSKKQIGIIVAIVAVVLIIIIVAVVVLMQPSNSGGTGGTGGNSTPTYRRIIGGGKASSPWDNPESNTIVPGYNVFTTTLDACQQRCNETPGCEGVNWVRARSPTDPWSCWLAPNKDSTVDSRGVWDF